MNKRITKYLLSIISFFAGFLPMANLKAQLTVTPNQTAQQLVQRLVGPNVAVLNPVLTCASDGNGQFTAVGSNLGIDGGIILCSGTATTLSGPYNNSIGLTQVTPGDAELNALSGQTTHDACILEFDFVPDVDSISTLRFKYVFGSEEYPGYTCSVYNDVFGFLLSGPGYFPPVNIATVPGTNIPVAINSVNSGAASGGWPFSNCTGMGPGSPFPQYFVNNNAMGGQTIALDGFTTELEATAVVYPCDTYHMKLGVANASDDALQSAVFLRENSFTVDTVTLDLTGIIASDSGYLVEGCTPAIVKAFRTAPSPQKRKLCLSYGGTAINGLDYTMLPDTLVIPANSTVAAMILNPLQDNISEPGFETILIRRLNCCTMEPIDSIEIKVRDSLKMELLSQDVLICGSDTVVLHATGDPSFTYSWTPTVNVNNPFDTLTLAFPTQTTVYTVKASFQSCPDVSRSFTAFVEPVPDVHIIPDDTAFCISGPYHIKVDVQPASFPNYTYTWASNMNLSDPFVKEPDFYANYAGTFTYVLAVQTPIGCTGKDTLTLTTRPAVDLINVTGDFIAKYGDVVQLNSEGAEFYTWTPDKLLDFPNTQDPKANALDTVNFRLVGMNHWGCKDTAYVRMGIDYTMLEVVPSAFSPNNDGNNDVFRVGNIKYQRLQEFRVFNRWGQEVFSTTDPKKGWDGTFSGVPQEVGVYQYLIKVTLPNGVLRTYKGDVTLVR